MENSNTPLSCSWDVLGRTDASVRWCENQTIVLVSVLGPVEVKLKDEIEDRATIEVIVKNEIGAPTAREKFFEKTIQDVLQNTIMVTQYPRSLIQLVLQIQSDFGQTLTACINAAMAAILSSGVAVRHICLAADVESTAKKMKSDVSGIIVYDMTLKRPLVIDIGGVYTENELNQCQEEAMTRCQQVHQFVSQSLKKYYQSVKLAN